MPLNLQGFVGEPNQWTGLYHTADQLDKKNLQANQMSMQQQARRGAAGTFLQDYLDPKDMLTGTAYDPLLLQGLQAAMQRGAQLVQAGADAPMLMMALGPMVNKLTGYATNAKNVNKQIDERIKSMRDSGLTGYNYAILKEEALKSAFYKKGATGQLELDPDNIDLSQDYVHRAITEKPLEVTTDDVFDEFAKKAEKFKTKSDVTTYTPMGTTYRSKAHLTAPDYMVPETVIDPKSKEEVTIGFVPKHDIATEQAQPLYHKFNQGGKEVNAPVRVIDEELFDKGFKPAMQDRIRGMVQKHIGEYSNMTGKQIDINSPQAKLVARAIAYDMLNTPSRKGGSIEHFEQQGKPSEALINLRVQQTPEYRQNTFNKAADAKAGRVSVPDPNDPNQYKRNVGEAIGDIFTGKEDLSGIAPDTINGNLFALDGRSRSVKDMSVVDVTSAMPGGGLKSGRGANFDYKRVFFQPNSKTLILEQVETKPSGSKSIKFIEVPEANVGQFINKIAEANDIPKPGVRALLDKMGYKGNRFGGTDKPAALLNPAAQDNENRIKNKPSWRKAMTTVTDPFGQGN